MDRRNFCGAGLIAGAGVLAAGSSALAQAQAAPARAADAVKPADAGKKKFKLKYAPQFGHFEAHAGKDPIEQLRFMADQGFSALLDGGFLKKPVELQDKIIKEMEKLGMTLGGPYCSSGSMVASTDRREELAKNYKGICEQLKRVNAKWFLVVPGGLVKDMPMEKQSENVIENPQPAEGRSWQAPITVQRPQGACLYGFACHRQPLSPMGSAFGETFPIIRIVLIAF